MQRSLPIPLIVGLILGSACVVLVLAIMQAGKSASARSSITTLVEQRLAMSRLAQTLKDELGDIQQAARLYANSGRPRDFERHQALLAHFQQRSDLLADPPPQPSAVFVDIHNPTLMQFLAELNQANFQPDELHSLGQALQTIRQLGERQAGIVGNMRHDSPRTGVLHALTSPALEDLANQLRDQLRATQREVERRIDREVTRQRALIERLQQQLLSLLVFLGCLIAITIIIAYRYAMKPLRHLVEAATAIGSGRYDTRAQIFGLREIAELATTLNWMADSFRADLDARSAAERRAQKTEQRLRQINDSSPAVMWEIRQHPADGAQISFIGGAFEKLYSMPRQQALNSFQALLNGVHPDDRLNLLRSIRHAGEQRCDFSNEHRSLRPNGQYRWIRSHGQLQSDRDDVPVWSGYSVDIQELAELRKQLETALEAAEEGNRSKAAFLANLSHEIRTPMNAILGMTHLSLETELQPKQRDYLRRIDTSARLLLRIINDILDVSKIEADRLELEKLEFPLEQLIDNVMHVVDLRAQEKGLTLKLHIEPDVPRRLNGDSLRLGQILINLLSNAIKFTEQGEVALSLSASPGEAGSSRLRFEVRDTGVGILQDAQARLFTAFTQADSSTTRRFGGTGLGLTIAKKLAQLMDGDVRLEHSAPGQGSTFICDVFIAPVVDQDPPAAALKDLNGRHALIVDEDPIARELIGSALKHFGMRCTQSNASEDAIRLTQAHHFDVALLDLRLSSISALETASRMRSQPGWKGRILLLSGNDSEGEIRALTNNPDIDDILLKPADAAVLLETLTATLSNTRRQSVHRRQRLIPDLSHRHLLLAEDNPIGRELAQELLGRTGARLSIVSDGAEALRICAAEPVDLVLLDLHMPGIDGFQTARAMRKIPAMADTPLLAMSADPQASMHERSMAAGMNDFIAKPVDVDAFYAALARWLDAPVTTPTLLAATGPRPHTPLPGVDVEAGLARANFNHSLYLRLIAQLCRRFEHTPAELGDALQAQDWKRMHQQLHALKGAAANLGAEALARTCATLELQLSRPQADTCTALIQELQDQLQALHQALVPTDASPAEECTGQTEMDTATLEELARLIEAGDASARPFSQKIQAPAGHADLMQSIRSHLANYAFEEAAQELAKMKMAES